MGQATLRCLAEHGVGSILVVSRSFETAAPLAEAFGGTAVRWTELEQALLQADIVICSTSAGEYLLTPAQVRRSMTVRRQRPLFFIDISVPRNLDPRIGELDNVYLYDIDDLEGIASANRQRRLEEVRSCTSIIEAHLKGFLGRLPHEGDALGGVNR
jgi:glutamyl-tRNA reductase